MFQNISELVVRTADLVEAEGRALRHHTLRLCMAVALVVVAAALLLGSLIALLWALHIALGSQIGSAWSWAIIGAVGLGLVFGLMQLATRTAETPQQSNDAPSSVADEVTLNDGSERAAGGGGAHS